jgi:hypothetical protein
MKELHLASQHVHGSHLEELLLSRLAQCKGHWEDAAKILQDVLIKHPEHPDVIREIGMLYADQQKCDAPCDIAYTFPVQLLFSEATRASVYMQHLFTCCVFCVWLSCYFCMPASSVYFLHFFSSY